MKSTTDKSKSLLFFNSNHKFTFAVHLFPLPKEKKKKKLPLSCDTAFCIYNRRGITRKDRIIILRRLSYFKKYLKAHSKQFFTMVVRMEA